MNFWAEQMKSSMETEFNSPLLEGAVNALSRLPGVGRKTALRLALHILRRPADEAEILANAISALRRDIRYCTLCHNISEDDICPICASDRRDHSIVCVVENVRDVMNIENTGQYSGVYHVLGGLISPVDGIGPDALEIDSLLDRCAPGPEAPAEVILALSPTMEGDMTNSYIYRRLRGVAPAGMQISQLARGLALGNELEYTDELTLGRSLTTRTPFNDSF